MDRLLGHLVMVLWQLLELARGALLVVEGSIQGLVVDVWL